MINFIIHVENAETYKKYENIIFNFAGNRKEKFNISGYENNIKNNQSRNIYILASKNVNKALDIAKSIRTNNNWYDQIIILTNTKNLNYNLLNNDLLILKYIDIKKVKNDLKNALCSAYKILTSDYSLNFSINGEIYKIPYNDILYIEKDNNQNYCLIKTFEKTFTIKDTITSLENKLDSVCFMKTHRSCIINLNNIANYKLSNNIITFINNYQIDLISRDKRTILKEKLVDEKIIKED